MSSSKPPDRLRQRLRRHTEVLEQLLQSPPLLRGSFSRVSTRCGKPNCWCAHSAQGHRHARLTWSEQGRMMTRKVPLDQISRIRKLTANYRRFRATRRKLIAIQEELRRLLDEYEAARVSQTREPLQFLAVNPKMSAARRSTRQKDDQSQK